MKYYIVVNDQLTETDDLTFDNWIEAHGQEYLLPEYSTVIDGTFFGLETMYQGAIDIDEEVVPFILLYFEDVASLTTEGISVDMEANRVEYFASFKELAARYNELLTEIKARQIMENK